MVGYSGLKEIQAIAAEATTKSKNDSGELNEYGLTDTQLEALLAEVKEAVTEEYLNPNNISPSEFKLLPYDVNDLKNYENGYSNGNYIGEDPYECSRMWRVISDTILWTDSIEDHLYVGQALGDIEIFLDVMKDSDFFLEDTLETQCKKNGEKGATYEMEPSTRGYSLMNGVYMGIARFLNGLEKDERIKVMYYLYGVFSANSEDVTINGSDYRSATMFDKVISENIQF